MQLQACVSEILQIKIGMNAIGNLVDTKICYKTIELVKQSFSLLNKKSLK